MRSGLLATLLVLATAATGGDAQTPTIRWQRPPGVSRYQFTSTEQRPDGASSITLEVAVTVREGAPDVLTIERGHTGNGPTESRPIQIDEACVRLFGGRDGTIGRVEMTEGSRPFDLVPQCVPEGVFGAVTDLVSMLLVQHPSFHIRELKATGDSARFPGFQADWERTDPAPMHARVAAPGGTIKLAALREDLATVEWRPDPMEVTIGRRTGPSQGVLLRGVEHFALELSIDPRSGALRAARSIEDHLDLRLWVLQSAELPALASTPPGDGLPVSIVRTLALAPR